MLHKIVLVTGWSSSWGRAVAISGRKSMGSAGEDVVKRVFLIFWSRCPLEMAVLFRRCSEKSWYENPWMVDK